VVGRGGGVVSAVLFALAGLLVVLALLFAVLSLTAGNQNARFDSFRQNCVEAGGHIYSIDVAFCVTDDGRFIEVYP
jgi:hypothetical protein